MATAAPAESLSVAVLPPMRFPRTWGELQDVLDTIGLNGAYGDRRIVLMQGQNGEYSRLRQEESDLIMHIGRHEAGELFSDPHDVTCLRTILHILGVPVTSSPAKPDETAACAEAFRRGIDRLFSGGRR